MNRRDEIRARLDAATPGPWEWGGGNIIYTPPTHRSQRSELGRKGPYNSYRLATAGDEGAWRDEDAALIAHAPDDLRDLLAVAEAARDHREGVVADHSGICPHCGADDCWSDPEGAFMPLRCAATGRAVWVGGGDADEYLAAALDRLDAVTGGERHRPSQSATKIHPLGGER